MEEKLAFDYSAFIQLPAEVQIRIIQLIDNDKLLMNFLQTSQ